MVENDILNFELKLKNAIKHSIGRNVIKIMKCEKSENGVILEIKTPDYKEGFEIEIPEKYSLKDAVCYVLHLSQLDKFMYITITNTDPVRKDILKSFSNQKVPEFFKICKIPKKQIQVQVANKKDYINIGLQSYQKVLSKVDHIKKWPATIQCKDFMDCFKRREFVTILLQVSQLVQ